MREYKIIPPSLQSDVCEVTLYIDDQRMWNTPTAYIRLSTKRPDGTIPISAGFLRSMAEIIEAESRMQEPSRGTRIQ